MLFGVRISSFGTVVCCMTRIYQGRRSNGSNRRAQINIQTDWLIDGETDTTNGIISLLRVWKLHIKLFQFWNLPTISIGDHVSLPENMGSLVNTLIYAAAFMLSIDLTKQYIVAVSKTFHLPLGQEAIKRAYSWSSILGYDNIFLCWHDGWTGLRTKPVK